MTGHDQELLAAFEADQIVQHYFDQLKALVAKKSIFVQQIGLLEVASDLKRLFEEAGATVTLDDSYAAPFVMAKFTSPIPNAKTLIFYNHYDTVPADSDQPWTDDPFTLTVRDGYAYGRGVDDDKGHITARLSAVVRYLKRHEQLPVNIIFIMEGAEESASVDLDKYLQKYQKELAGADLLIWEQGIRNSQGQLEISGGNKGIVTFDVTVDSAEVDSHSSFGGVIDSAPWYLLQALSSLRGRDGQILVKGIAEQVIQPSQRELDLVETFAQRSPEGVQAAYDLSLPLLKADRASFLRNLFFEPSINIEGIQSGYQDQGVKTILPSKASAKMEVRLVPGLTPDGVLDAIRRHLIEQGFEKAIITKTLGEMSYRSDMSSPAILNLIAVAESYEGREVAVLPTSPGTGPMHTVFHSLGVPIAGFGLGHEKSRDHGGDENIRLVDYYSHIELVESFIKSYE
ncbi:M20/M25/M40 family metallo-hydrolase [Streptococcus merionis]|uniref:Putative succinyl-diaminopimelate desuccinylase n=1 Tax=Streptococcus merionis TaxID=400065 RepID=A0A239SV93_9STRE|nr:M20/M25/M40 family metallo-hydrolase [Streptococcus merionis]SNU89189.1 putative succinyl-diaminopimelate desuccinylase [Streptococcus merionis]